jgi:hypothetical protein
MHSPLCLLPSGQFTVQDSNPYSVGQRDSDDVESRGPSIDTRQVFLDDGSSLVPDSAPRTSFWVSLTQSRREQRECFLPSDVVLTDCRAHRKDDHRLRPPQPVKPYQGLYYVQSYGNACPQQSLVLPNGLDSILVNNINQVVTTMYDKLRPTDEDCECHVRPPPSVGS